MTIYEALAGINIPVCHTPYKGDSASYVTYQNAGQIGAKYAEGKEAETACAFNVDLWTKTFDFQKMTTVKEMLEAAGFIVTVELEDYNAELDINHVSFFAQIEGSQYG